MGWIYAWKTLKPDPYYCYNCHDAIGWEYDPVSEEWDICAYWTDVIITSKHLERFCSRWCCLQTKDLKPFN